MRPHFINISIVVVFLGLGIWLGIRPWILVHKTETELHQRQRLLQQVERQRLNDEHMKEKYSNDTQMEQLVRDAGYHKKTEVALPPIR